MGHINTKDTRNDTTETSGSGKSLARGAHFYQTACCKNAGPPGCAREGRTVMLSAEQRPRISSPQCRCHTVLLRSPLSIPLLLGTNDMRRPGGRLRPTCHPLISQPRTPFSIDNPSTTPPPRRDFCCLVFCSRVPGKLRSLSFSFPFLFSRLFTNSTSSSDPVSVPAVRSLPPRRALPPSSYSLPRRHDSCLSAAFCQLET